MIFDMSQMAIKIIYDNCKASEGFQEGWGFSCLVDLYPNDLKNREFDKKGALNLSQAKPAQKRHNLNKLCDACGLEDNSGCPTQSKTDFSGRLGIGPRKILFD